MPEEDYSYFLTFLLREDGRLQVAGMTLEWIALALTDRTRVRLRVNYDFSCRLVAVLVPLALYEHVAALVEFDEAGTCCEQVGEEDDEEEVEEEFGFDHNCYVKILANLHDGRAVEVAIHYDELDKFVDREDKTAVVDVNYRTRYALGRDAQFADFLIHHAVAIELGVVPAVRAYLS